MRSLRDLVKQAEKATQVRRSGLDEVLAELKEHRDEATDANLRASLTQLCNALTRFLQDQTASRAREVAVSVGGVKLFLPPAERGGLAEKLRFWK